MLEPLEWNKNIHVNSVDSALTIKSGRKKSKTTCESGTLMSWNMVQTKRRDILADGGWSNTVQNASGSSEVLLLQREPLLGTQIF